MKRNTVLDKITALCAAVLTLICTAFSAISYIKHFDTKLGYFDPGVFHTLFIVFILIYIVGSAVMSLICCMGRKIAYDDPMPIQYTALGTGAVTSFYLASLAGMMIANGIEPGISGILPFIIIILGGIGLVYYILTFMDSRDLDAFRSIGALALVLFGIADALYVYFTKSMPVNGDIKNITMLALISQFLFFLFEAKRILGAQSPIPARFFTLLAFMAGTVASVPEIISTVLGNSAGFTAFSRAVCLLAVSVYAFVRLVVGKAKTLEIEQTQGEANEKTTVIDVLPESETETAGS